MQHSQRSYRIRKLSNKEVSTFINEMAPSSTCLVHVHVDNDGSDILIVALPVTVGSELPGEVRSLQVNESGRLEFSSSDGVIGSRGGQLTGCPDCGETIQVGFRSEHKQECPGFRLKKE